MKINFSNYYTCVAPLYKRTTIKENTQREREKHNDTVSLSGLYCIQNYNISFTGKPIAIYAIDKDMKYQKFSSTHKAAKELNLPSPCVLNCISGKSKYSGDYCFVKASEVETENENGPIINEDKIKQIYETAQIARKNAPNVRKKPIYAIDKNETLTRFESVTEASEKLNIEHSRIFACLSGKNNTAGMYIFFEADEIETNDNDSDIKIDNRKLAKKIQEMHKAFLNPYVTEKMPIYAIHKNGSIQRFELLVDAIKELRTSHQSITACLAGKKQFVGDYCFILADEVETKKEDGTIDIDKEKIEALKHAAQVARDNDTCVRGKAIYAIKLEDLTFQKFETSAQAAKELKLHPTNISSCIAGRTKAVGGYSFIPAYKIEVEEENSELHVDIEKMKQELKRLQEQYTLHRQTNKGNVSKSKPEEQKITQKEKDSGNKTSKNILPIAIEPITPTVKISKVQKKEPVYKSTEKISPIPKTQPQKAATKNPKKEASKSKNPDIKKYKKLGKIYAYKPSGDLLEFKNMQDASIQLGVESDKIYKALRRATGEINGLLFSCDADA